MSYSKKLSITDLTSKYRDGSLSPVDIVKQELNKIRQINPRVNPIVEQFDEKEILRQAKESEARYKSGKPLGIFDGIPITLKDDSIIKGFRSSMGSWFLKNGAFEFMGMGGPLPPTQSEKCIKMFEDSGAIPLCVTTTPEMCCTVTFYFIFIFFSIFVEPN